MNIIQFLLLMTPQQLTKLVTESGYLTYVHSIEKRTEHEDENGIVFDCVASDMDEVTQTVCRERQKCGLIVTFDPLRQRLSVDFVQQFDDEEQEA